MGYAMLKKWTTEASDQFWVVEPDGLLRRRAEEVGARAFGSREELPLGLLFDVVVIATKPQFVCDIIDFFSGHLAERGLFISVAAGVRIPEMEARAGQTAAIVRAMPNTPAAIGEGMIVACTNGNVSGAGRETTEKLLSAVGRLAFLEQEDKMDAVTAVSGSGPAYVFYFIEALTAAGVNAGLEEELAKVLAEQTVFGAAKLVHEGKNGPGQLREAVTSPNGTTAAALSVLMSNSNGLQLLLDKAVSAAKERSIELAAPAR